MYAALPRPDYYGGSAPRTRRRRTWRLAGLRWPGARIGVPVFEARNPWRGRWPAIPLAALAAPRFGTRGEAHPWRVHPVVRPRPTGLAQHARRCRRVAYPYRGFQHRLQHAWTFIHAGFTMAPAVTRLGRPCVVTSIWGRSAFAGRRSSLGDVHGPLLHPVRPGRGWHRL